MRRAGVWPAPRTVVPAHRYMTTHFVMQLGLSAGYQYATVSPRAFFFFQHVRGLQTGVLARARALNLRVSWTWLFSAITAAFALIGPAPTLAAEAQANRMVVEYVPPTNPAHQVIYQRLMERRDAYLRSCKKSSAHFDCR